MSIIKEHKVNSLPSSLENNSKYFVKNGSGFDFYITNNTGTLLKIKNPEIQQGSSYIDSNYIYSVFGNTTAWQVYRYNRSSNLALTKSNGTGTVPNTLVLLGGLTYS